MKRIALHPDIRHHAPLIVYVALTLLHIAVALFRGDPLPPLPPLPFSPMPAV